MPKQPTRPSFTLACARYVNRFTVDHIPCWSTLQAPGGKFYAPQFASDREWFDNTKFPGEKGYPFEGSIDFTECYTTGQTWPLGKWLDAPFTGRAK